MWLIPWVSSAFQMHYMCSYDVPSTHTAAICSDNRICWRSGIFNARKWAWNRPLMPHEPRKRLRCIRTNEGFQQTYYICDLYDYVTGLVCLTFSNCVFIARKMFIVLLQWKMVMKSCLCSPSECVILTCRFVLDICTWLSSIHFD